MSKNTKTSCSAGGTAGIHAMMGHAVPKHQTSKKQKVHEGCMTKNDYQYQNFKTLLGIASGGISFSAAHAQPTDPSVGHEEEKPPKNVPTLKNMGEIVVHPRFTHFLLMLWFICKLDHVLRNYTRCWLEAEVAAEKKNSAKGQETNVHHLCEKFAGQEELFKSLCSVFNHGFRHIRTSLQKIDDP